MGISKENIEENDIDAGVLIKLFNSNFKLRRENNSVCVIRACFKFC